MIGDDPVCCRDIRDTRRELLERCELPGRRRHTRDLRELLVEPCELPGCDTGDLPGDRLMELSYRHGQMISARAYSSAELVFGGEPCP